MRNASGLPSHIKIKSFDESAVNVQIDSPSYQAQLSSMDNNVFSRIMNAQQNNEGHPSNEGDQALRQIKIPDTFNKLIESQQSTIQICDTLEDNLNQESSKDT